MVRKKIEDIGVAWVKDWAIRSFRPYTRYADLFVIFLLLFFILLTPAALSRLFLSSLGDDNAAGVI